MARSGDGVAQKPRIDEEAAWSAVSVRDVTCDGTFVYGVTSTGVYCRPSCPARRPSRENVRFFGGPDEAELAGFRACQRCRPREQVATEGERKVRDAATFIRRHAAEPLPLARLADEVGLSPAYLQRTFTRLFGQSPRRYQTALRVEALKRRLKDGDLVSVAAYEVGFGSSRGLYDQGAKAMGMSPATYRRRGKGLTIRYTLVPSSLGHVLIGVTERGVCSVLLGDDERAVLADLQKEFGEAVLIRDDTAMAEEIERVMERLAGRSSPPIRLDLQGTDFQRRVWAALSEIPAGQTRSYGEVARRLGAPAAVRAVAGACAANHVAVVVPCHRVVRKSGGLGGYRWGVKRKNWLLKVEAAASSTLKK